MKDFITYKKTNSFFIFRFLCHGESKISIWIMLQIFYSGWNEAVEKKLLSMCIIVLITTDTGIFFRKHKFLSSFHSLSLQEVRQEHYYIILNDHTISNTILLVTTSSYAVIVVAATIIVRTPDRYECPSASGRSLSAPNS